jgi:hypothetical protein
MSDNSGVDNLVLVSAKNFEAPYGGFSIPKMYLVEVAGLTSTPDIAMAIQNRAKELGKDLRITVREKLWNDWLEIEWAESDKVWENDKVYVV